MFAIFSRSPHGERGLKYEGDVVIVRQQPSLPAWGAWIEIAQLDLGIPLFESLPAWGAWIEIV